MLAALPRNSILSLLGRGDKIGTPGEVGAAFSLQSKSVVPYNKNCHKSKDLTTRSGRYGGTRKRKRRGRGRKEQIRYLGELAPLILRRLILLARLGLRLALRGECVPGTTVSIGVGIPAASNLARRLESSLVNLFMTASDSASSSCSIRILSAFN